MCMNLYKIIKLMFYSLSIKDSFIIFTLFTCVNVFIAMYII